jgi:hypothetical protein
MARHRDDRPHPLRHEATLRGVIVGVGAVGAIAGVDQVGFLTEQATQMVQLFATGGAVIAAPVLAARAGEKHVTPVSDPRDNQGRRLVPVDTTPEI